MTRLELAAAKILIVDDQEGNILFLEGLLREGGYRDWKSLRDPREVARTCLEYQPDLILLDLLMPHLDGIAVLNQLAPQLREDDPLPVLMLTIDPTPEVRRRALAAGAKDFLNKPLDATEVLLRVKNLLETRLVYRRLRKSADEKLREQAALIDQASDAILVADLDDRIRLFSRGAEALYGLPASQAIGRTLGEVLAPPRPQALDLAARTTKEDGAWSGELPGRTPGGAELLVWSRWTLLRDPDGKPRSMLILNADITTQRQIEEELRQAQRMESIGRLAGGVAHDLNNVLSPVSMGIGLLRESCTDPEDRTLLESMENSIRRGADMVRHILTFAKGLRMRRGPMRLDALVGEVVSLLKPMFPKSIAFEATIVPDLPLVDGDPTQLHQVLVNLCVNARDAMPDGGTLKLDARPLSGTPPCSQSPDSARTPWVEVVVEDSGSGIPPAVLPRIFDPFFSTKPSGKGTGLGLATAQSIVKEHGGRIDVAPRSPQGTRFTIVLPALAAPVALRPPAPPRTLPGGKGETILVVDDEAALLSIARLTLSAAGYQVLTAGNGDEALSLLASRLPGPRLVLLDLMMPVLDGTRTLTTLRRIAPDLRIVVSSGLGTDLTPLRSAGIQDFLPKPYSMEELLSTVRRALDTPSARHEP